MKLQRYAIYSDGGYVVLPNDCRKDDDVAWCYAPDVADLLASIRAAVDAERASMRETNGCVLPGATLDALLSGERASATVHRCPSAEDSGIMPCCGRTPFEATADRMTSDPDLVTCTGRASR